MNNTDKLLISIEEMAEILSIGKSKAYEICRSPTFFPVIKLGRRKLVSVEDLKNWIKNNIGKI
jgi:excisionase family DNA binding protein